MADQSFPTRTEQGRRALRSQLLASDDAAFVSQIPKVELHVHIEGTLTPELRWKLAKRNGIPARMSNKTGAPELSSLEHVQRGYGSVISSAQLPSYAGCPPSETPPTFFEAYYSGCEVLRTRQDFFDLAYGYFQRAASMNVRYCEVFFDPQSHTSRGVSWEDLMGGLRDAQKKAEVELDVKSGWIMCFLRDSPVESALEHYHSAVSSSSSYKEMIIGFGLDSNETNHPPGLFDEVFALAHRDGFKITAHCDVGQRDTHANIRHVVSALGGGGEGADRVDHGLNAVDEQDLIDLVSSRGIGLTICPWAYLRRWPYEECAERMRSLLLLLLPGNGDGDGDGKKKGIKVCISSDSPAYQDDCWVVESLLLTKKLCGLSEKGLLEMMRGSVEMSWAENGVKEGILGELEEFWEGKRRGRGGERGREREKTGVA